MTRDASTPLRIVHFRWRFIVPQTHRHIPISEHRLFHWVSSYHAWHTPSPCRLCSNTTSASISLTTSFSSSTPCPPCWFSAQSDILRIACLFTCSLSWKLQLEGKWHRAGDLSFIYPLLYHLHLELSLQYGGYWIYDLLKEEGNITCFHILGKICKIYILFFSFLTKCEFFVFFF